MMNVQDYYTMSMHDVHTVASKIEKLLKGNKYTWVECYEYAGYIPKAETGRVFDDIYTYIESDMAGFHVLDSCGVWGCWSTQEDRKFDPTYKNPYVEFGYNFVRITLRTPEGRLAYWIAIVEDPAYE